jgi:hypothetical protein
MLAKQTLVKLKEAEEHLPAIPNYNYLKAKVKLNLKWQQDYKS